MYLLRAGRAPDCKACAHKRSRIYSDTTDVKSPEYDCWKGMLDRCGNAQRPAWKNYGARGIKVCERWIWSFEDFRDDMGPRPTPKHTLERINNEGNYTPGNCRWATPEEQSQNTRVAHRLTFSGKTMGVKAWNRRLGIPRRKLADLYRRRQAGDVPLYDANPTFRRRAAAVAMADSP